MKKRTLEYKMRHIQRRIGKLNKCANRAYKQKHNIIAVNYLNRAMVYELQMERMTQCYG